MARSERLLLVLEVHALTGVHLQPLRALEAGYSRASQHYQFKTGNWRREGHGIYRLERFPRTPDEHYVRLMLWSRDRAGNIQAAVSHETALQAYELSDVMPADIHLTVPKGFRKQPPDDVKARLANIGLP